MLSLYVHIYKKSVKIHKKMENAANKYLQFHQLMIKSVFKSMSKKKSSKFRWNKRHDQKESSGLQFFTLEKLPL